MVTQDVILENPTTNNRVILPNLPVQIKMYRFNSKHSTYDPKARRAHPMRFQNQTFPKQPTVRHLIALKTQLSHHKRFTLHSHLAFLPAPPWALQFTLPEPCKPAPAVGLQPGSGAHKTPSGERCVAGPCLPDCHSLLAHETVSITTSPTAGVVALPPASRTRRPLPSR